MWEQGPRTVERGCDDVANMQEMLGGVTVCIAWPRTVSSVSWSEEAHGSDTTRGIRGRWKGTSITTCNAIRGR